MPFNDTTNETGVVQEINDICNSDNNSYPLKSKARRVNQALDRFFTLAFRAARQQSFGDLNDTTAPIESQNLVSSQQAYDLDDFTSEIIKVARIEVKNSDGVAHEITPLDTSKVLGALSEYQDTPGIPNEYKLFGKKLYLYPAPSYNYTSGLTMYFDRNKSSFASTDTTKTLGIPSLFYKYICNHASLPYLIENGKAQKNDIKALILEDEKAIEDYFYYRLPRIAPQPIIFM